MEFGVPAGEAEDAVVDEKLLEQATTSLETRDPPQLPLGTFVLSILLHTLFKRLHVTGACPRAPGLHYKEPPAKTFDARCLHCFPQSKGVVVAAEAADVQSPSTSDSSSESVSE